MINQESRRESLEEMVVFTQDYGDSFMDALFESVESFILYILKVIQSVSLITSKGSQFFLDMYRFLHVNYTSIEWVKNERLQGLIIIII